jgi:hypothetical protein
MSRLRLVSVFRAVLLCSAYSVLLSCAQEDPTGERGKHQDGRWRLVKFASVWPRAGRAEYEEWSSAHEMPEIPLGAAWDSPRRLHIVNPTSFEDGARDVADRFKRHQSVILDLQRADEDLAKRMVDFSAGLSYALDGRMQTIVEGLFLLTPSGVEVSSKESLRDGQRAFFNRL